jgi:hypothetical protein
MAGAARRRRTRRRPARSARGPWVTGVVVVAVGLVALSAPATEVAAQLTAATSRVSPPEPVQAPAASLAQPDTTEPLNVEPPVVSSGIAPALPSDLEVRLPRPNVPRGVAPPMEPRPDTACSGYPVPRRIVPGVVPGPGTATLSWRSDASADVQRYRVQAVSQRLVPGPQPEPPALTVGQPAGCEELSVTFTGLDSGVAYVFWLEEEVRDSLSLKWVQVGTTAPVSIG